MAKKNITVDELRRKLKVKHLEAKKSFAQKHKKAHEHLKSKGVEVENLREHSAKIVGIGALAGGLLLGQPTNTYLPAPNAIVERKRAELVGEETKLPQKLLMRSIGEILPEAPRPLTRAEEKRLEGIFSEVIKVPARATLEGEHLNTTFGYIGAEQHLRRYPGDVNENHGDGKVLKEGMAPGLGAWGYFAQSGNALTPDLVETEKWYAVVQTLYLPDWNSRTRYLRDWYKYRKVLIVNTDNGQAVVAAIADSGPAAWTGKHFGGSPEVMMHLGGSRYKKGPVVIFFVDDPDNKVPLGPVEYNEIKVPLVALVKS